MSQISITRRHDKSIKDAKTAVNKVARAIARKFSVEHRWEEHTLHFTRSGVDGHIALSKGQVRVHVQLGFLLALLKQPIADEIARVLDEEFG